MSLKRVHMTDAELWRQVGERLAAARLRRGYTKYQYYVRAHGRPATATIQAIEAGRPGNIASLTEYATALGFSLPHLLFEVLSGGKTASLPPVLEAVVDALQVAPASDELAQWQKHTKLMGAVVMQRGGAQTIPSPPPRSGAAAAPSRAKRRRRAARSE